MPYNVTILWQKGPNDTFVDNKYSRGHLWRFDGGIEIAGSSSPHVVPLPLSVEAAVDPEEAFIASLSSCHMLWFLSIAAEKGFIVESYQDNAEGILGENDEGKLAMTKVTLRPKVVFGGENAVTDEHLEEIHHEAHEKCFIANSVKTNVVTEPVWDIG